MAPSQTPQPSATTSKLFTLPAELQAQIYSHILIEAAPIHINVNPKRKRHGQQMWRLTATVNGQKVHKPALLRVCRHLRDFATPIYFASNTFSSLSQGFAKSVKKRHVLKCMWGPDVRHIRSLVYSITVGIRLKWDDVRIKPKTEDIVVTTRLKMMEGGTLIMSRHSSGTKNSRLFPEGEMCICELEAFAKTLVVEGRGTRPLLEIVEECGRDDYGVVDVGIEGPERTYEKMCEGCGRLRFWELSRYEVKEGRPAGGLEWL